MIPDYLRKMERADHHIDALNESFHRWMDRGAYSIVRKRDPETGYNIACAEIKEPLDPAWPLIAGDAAHNLRAALDQIAFALMVSHQGTVNPGAPIPAGMVHSSEFPVISDENERSGETGVGSHQFDSKAGRSLTGIDPAARAAIKSIQPYHRGDAWRTHPLWLIHDLD